jgi:hypothetical protein
MLVAVPSGVTFERTLSIWDRGLDVLREAGEPAFQLAAMPLNAFLDHPDWADPPADPRWVYLTQGQRRSPERGLQNFLRQVPRRNNPLHDRLILAALLREIHRTPLPQAEIAPRPDPAFFDLMRIIHSASHAPDLPPQVQAGYPWASLFLLKHYLYLHPALRKQINRRMRQSAMQMRWNTTVILHRMQSVVDDFLAYHGWRSDGPLLAYADTSPWQQAAVRTFGVHVQIRAAEILMPPGEQIVPYAAVVAQSEQALAWVLTAIFRHAPDLGIKSPLFW